MKGTVLFLSNGDPFSTRTWSSTPYYVRENLEAMGFSLVYFDPYGKYLARLVRLFRAAAKRMPGRKIDPNRLRWLVKILSRRIAKAVKHHQPDFVFALSSSYQWAYLKRHCPDLKIVAYGDATFPQMLDYYPQYSALSPASRRRGMEVFQRSLEDASLVLWPSVWALESAQEHSRPEHREKHRLLPFRPNLPPLAYELAEEALAKGAQRTPGAPVQVLFIGVDWERKGGNIVADAVQAARAEGHDVRVTIVGVEPPEGLPGMEHAEVFPRLEKTRPSELRLLCQLLSAADLLFIPTSAEAFGIVFVEALLFGVPSLARETGGVPSAVGEGAALLLPGEAGSEAFAEAFVGLLSDRPRLEELRSAARREGVLRASWGAWQEMLGGMLREIGVPGD